jgi:uncharacterized integral membrane protein (TIGR00697 family)
MAAELKNREGFEGTYEKPSGKMLGQTAPLASAPRSTHKKEGMLRLDKTQAAIILCGLYLFFSFAGNIAATKVTYFGSLVMDAGFIYSLTFTWRDLIHKQLGKSAAVTTIWLSAAINLLAALYFQIVVLMPAEPSWAAAGGQAAWEFLFSLQFRIVLASIITALIAELIDTRVYHLWTRGVGMNRPQWTRVLVSNSISIPVDSVLFPLIAFLGVISADAMVQMFWTNLVVKAIVTMLAFWTIYIVPERPIYED